MATFKTSIIADSLWCDWSQWKSHLIKWRCSTKSIQIPLGFTISRKLLQFHQKLVKLCSRSTVKWSQTSSGGGGGVGWCNKRKSFLFILFRQISNLVSSTISIDTLKVKEKRIGICFKSKLSLYVSVSIDLEKKRNEKFWSKGNSLAFGWPLTCCGCGIENVIQSCGHSSRIKIKFKLKLEFNKKGTNNTVSTIIASQRFNWLIHRTIDWRVHWHWNKCALPSSSTTASHYIDIEIDDASLRWPSYAIDFYF